MHYLTSLVVKTEIKWTMPVIYKTNFKYIYVVNVLTYNLLLLKKNGEQLFLIQIQATPIHSIIRRFIFSDKIML